HISGWAAHSYGGCTRPPVKARNRERSLDPRLELDAARDVDAEGPHRGDRGGDVAGVESTGEHQLRATREIPGGVPVTHRTAAASRSLEENAARHGGGRLSAGTQDRQPPEPGRKRGPL